MQKIIILGTGSFAGALTKVLAYNKNEVLIYDIDNNYQNNEYFQEISLNENIVATNNLKQAVCYAKVIIFAVLSTSRVLHSACQQINELITYPVYIVKGFESNSGEMLLLMISKNLKPDIIEDLSLPYSLCIAIEILHYIFIDTGLMYRALTLYCLVNKIDIDDAGAVIKVLANIRFSYDSNGNVYVNGIKQNSCDLSSKKVVNQVSSISAIKAVRTFMIENQRAIVQGFGYILAGRDIGTVVLPNAQLKVFLTATITKRAQRRVEQAQQQGRTLELSNVKENLQNRDRQDSDRKISPLKKADDAIEIDNSNWSLEQVVDLIATMVYEIKKNQRLLRVRMHS